MPFNVYLQRATRSLRPEIRRPAKVIAGGLGYMDRLLGVSARKMRTKADAISHLQKSKQVVGFGDKRFADKLHSRADHLTRQSNSTRIKTGLSIGGLVLANKALSNYKATQPEMQYVDPYNPQNYQY